jgi:hypothetical protein
MFLINGFAAIAEGWVNIFSSWFSREGYEYPYKTDEEAFEADRDAIYQDWCKVGDDMRKVMG